MVPVAHVQANTYDVANGFRGDCLPDEAELWQVHEILGHPDRAPLPIEAELPKVPPANGGWRVHEDSGARGQMRRGAQHRQIAGGRDRHHHRVDVARPQRPQILNGAHTKGLSGLARMSDVSRVDPQDPDIGVQQFERG